MEGVSGSFEMPVAAARWASVLPCLAYVCVCVSVCVLSDWGISMTKAFETR